jgi:predicted enzyme related to lactoylglutathione lyase
MGEVRHACAQIWKDLSQDGPGRALSLLVRQATEVSLGANEASVNPALNRVLLYAKNVEVTVAFYEKHFGFKASREEGDRIVELVPPHGGAIIMVHAAAKSVKQGQVTVKLVFDVEDVEGFVQNAVRNGLKFGTLHRYDGYLSANGKDPNGNSISVSSRAFRKADRFRT